MVKTSAAPAPRGRAAKAPDVERLRAQLDAYILKRGFRHTDQRRRIIRIDAEVIELCRPKWASRRHYMCVLFEALIQSTVSHAPQEILDGTVGGRIHGPGQAVGEPQHLWNSMITMRTVVHHR